MVQEQSEYQVLPSKQEEFSIKQIDPHLIWLPFKKHFWSIQ